ncbi:hypothetical protein IE53DRAFT_362336 [Violaceomyces palustris]|uniref:Uncharacterized protein n=1 Tax=Violaceomyces palustris TaxID=1673888 RepID=A0ACD0NXI3_9BASI|nr:hypothetical protein IE53DRAFT_362336 [Violaceomyces palustris]
MQEPGGFGSRPLDQELQEEEGEEVFKKPIKLSQNQQTKLRNYLDQAFLSIARSYRKRFDASTELPDLESYLQAWNHILAFLSNIPVTKPSVNLLVPYLLRLTDELSDGITGYDILLVKRHGGGNQSSKDLGLQGQEDEGHASDPRGSNHRDRPPPSLSENDQVRFERSQTVSQLNAVLRLLDLVDRLWYSVLRGRQIDFKVALTNSANIYPILSDERVREEGVDGSKDDFKNPFDNPTSEHMRIRLDAASGATSSSSSSSYVVPSPGVDGRFSTHPSSNSNHGRKESLPIQGAIGTKTVGQTDRVRLRNIVVTSKEKLFLWMRKSLRAPPPPTLREEEVEFEEGIRQELDQADQEDRQGFKEAVLSAGKGLPRFDGLQDCDVGVKGEKSVYDGIVEEVDEEEEEEEEEEGDKGVEVKVEVEEKEEDEGLDFDQVEIGVDGNEGNLQEDEHPSDEGALIESGGGSEEDQDGEGRHYRELFERKIDPDDSEEEEGGGGRSDREDEERARLEESLKRNEEDNQLFKRSLSVSSSFSSEISLDLNQPPPRKKVQLEKTGQGTELEEKVMKETEEGTEADEVLSYGERDHNAEEEGGEEEDDDDGITAKSGASSVGLGGVSDNIVQWDLAFTRIYSRTLRTLSDIIP